MVSQVDDATYPLEWVKRLFRQKHWFVTLTAQSSALDLGLDDEDIADCIMNCLTGAHFYKTMPAEKRPGLMQDVYRITYQGRCIYLKLQVSEENWAVVVSFKEE
jgi:hypothetical protein